MSFILWTEDLIISELKKYIEEHNSLFGLTERNSKLYGAITRSKKTLYCYLEKMGYSLEEIKELKRRMPKDTDWTLDKIGEAIREVLDKHQTLYRISTTNHKLDSAIRKRGGFRQVLLQLGYLEDEIESILPRENKRRNYEDIKSELIEHIKIHGDLKGFNMKNTVLSSYMKSHKINLFTVLDDIYGKENLYHDLLLKVPLSYWNEERILKRISNYVDTHSSCLKFRIEEKVFYNGVILKLKGLEYYVGKLGYDIADFIGSTKPAGYWQNYDNFTKEVLLLKDKLGRFPSSNECMVNGISMGSAKLFGGYAKIREKLGYVSDHIIYAKDNHICNSHGEALIDNFLFENGIPHQKEVRISPSHRYLCDFLLPDNAYVELWGFSKCLYNNEYHRTKAKKIAVYKQLNLKLISINHSDMQKPYERLIEYLRVVFKDYIMKDNIKYNPAHIVPKYDRTLEGLKKELQPYILDGSYMPSEYDLVAEKRNDLVWLIKKFGGFEPVAKKLNFLSKRDLVGANPLGYWTEDTIKYEMDILYNRFGYMPTYSEIRYNINKKLASAICAKGGYEYFVDKFNYRKKKDVVGNFYDIKRHEIKSELKNVLEEVYHKYNFMPSMGHLTHLIDKKYITVIRTSGGYEKILDKLGINYTTEREFLEKMLSELPKEDVTCPRCGGSRTSIHMSNGRAKTIYCGDCSGTVGIAFCYVQNKLNNMLSM